MGVFASSWSNWSYCWGFREINRRRVEKSQISFCCYQSVSVGEFSCCCMETLKDAVWEPVSGEANSWCYGSFLISFLLFIYSSKLRPGEISSHFWWLTSPVWADIVTLLMNIVDLFVRPWKWKIKPDNSKSEAAYLGKTPNFDEFCAAIISNRKALFSFFITDFFVL